MTVLCVECQTVSEDNADEALSDDYLCQAHRDAMDGVRYCDECDKRYTPRTEGGKLCPTCADKQKCEYCGKLYSHKRMLAAARTKVSSEPGKEKFLHHGVRFKGLCKNCAYTALEAVPANMSKGYQETTCPDCNYTYDVKIDEQSLCV